MPFLIAFAVCVPLLPLLAQFAQSPDGAEMVRVAVNGGVLHPSGIPLQWWINRLFVSLLPGEPGWALSLVSWLGGMGTVACLILLLRRLRVNIWIGGLAATALVYSPVFSLMSLTPEKYTWLTFMQMFFVYRLVRVILDEDYSLRALLILALALGLALAQHSANVILLPPFLYVVLRPLWVGGRKRHARGPAVGRALAAVVGAGGVTVVFYISLLWQRSSLPWPDWGQLENLVDVWNHVVRQDYGVVSLYNNPGVGENSISAPGLLFKNGLGWHLAFLFVPIGVWAAWLGREARSVMGYLWMVVLPGLAVLASTKMPSGDFNTVMGYQERYPILLLPLLSVFWAWGLGFVLEKGRKWRRSLIACVGLFVAVHAVLGFRLHLKTNNNIVEIYREQARSELESGSVFWTGSDFTGFYGISDTIYPLKAMFGMEWYREKTLPRLAPSIDRLLRGGPPPTSLEDLFRRALNEGVVFTLTEPSRFLPQADIMARAEQIGVLWTFSATNRSLYTSKIVHNTVQLCDRFPGVWKGLPTQGLWFVREYLEAFRFAFLSAGDYLQTVQKPEPAAAARFVAEALVPGREPAQWIEKCEAYKALVTN